MQKTITIFVLLIIAVVTTPFALADEPVNLSGQDFYGNPAEGASFVNRLKGRDP